MQLTEKPDHVIWPETHCVYVEKQGSFMENAPKAWESLHKAVPALSEHNKIVGYMALYIVEKQVYRAGVALAAAAVNLPKGLEYSKFKGGPYDRFVLTGSYSELPEACGRVFEIVDELAIRVREDFCIENYVSDPRTTPADKTVTEILIPTA